MPHIPHGFLKTALSGATRGPEIEGMGNLVLWNEMRSRTMRFWKLS